MRRHCNHRQQLQHSHNVLILTAFCLKIGIVIIVCVIGSGCNFPAVSASRIFQISEAAKAIPRTKTGQKPRQKTTTPIIDTKIHIKNFQQKISEKASTIMKSVNDDVDAAVLRELKEIIRKQADEILELKKKQQQVNKKSATPPSSHHHGASSDVSEDEMMAYLEKPFYKIATKRVGWLSLFLCSLSLTALIMNGFEHTLSRQIELAYFVPLLAGHGGNTGGQTVGTVLSALSAGTIHMKDAPRIISKEAGSGCMVGLILAMLLSPIAHYGMGISVHVSTVLLFTLPLVSTIAATLGSTIPFACLYMGLDPSVIAAPAMTSFVDVSGLMSYFLIANYIFYLFGIAL